ncbi:hypothetical protein R0137_11115 [Congregibacter brevis]|uniref:Uncharacterized protein n=1 Tax=Congregibacter brevis TaxID=3081201 RepID=A0ABZ0I9R5_9GAMM|nr:hypothetical protein R0137_11115 [Congregibacter sp. IMCC45268]
MTSDKLDFIDEMHVRLEGLKGIAILGSETSDPGVGSAFVACSVLVSDMEKILDDFQKRDEVAK